MGRRTQIRIALAGLFPYNGFPIRSCPVRTHEAIGRRRAVFIIPSIGPQEPDSDYFVFFPYFPIAGSLRWDGSADVCCTIYSPSAGKLCG